MTDDADLSAMGFIDAPMKLVSDLVRQYVAAGHDRAAMREIVAFVLSELGERTLTARLTGAACIKIGDCSLTLEQAKDRIAGLQALPVF